MAPPPAILLAVAIVAVMTAPAGAQNLMLSAAVQRDIQRFPEGDVPTRLDGSAAGWMVGADVRLRNHLVLAVEWSDAGTIQDARTSALDIDGRTVVITSTFRHDTRTAAALGGYSHRLSSRVRVWYLGGVSFTQVGREFASNAPGLVLVGPSDPSTSAFSTLVDRFWGLTGGVDAHVRIERRLHVVAGLRAQRITLHPATQSPRRGGPGLPLDVSGWSVRTFVGAGWGL
jgi:hypothetical protein